MARQALLACGLVVFCCLATVPAAGAEPVTLTLLLKPGLPAPASAALGGIQEIAPFYPGRTTHPALRRLVPRLWRLTVQPGVDPDAAMAAVAADARVAIVERRDRPALHYEPDDPDYPDQWFLPHVRADVAWNAIRGETTRAAVIGIVDTGVDWWLPEVSANVWVNEPEDLDGDGQLSPADLNGLDDDGNGFTDDVVGWDLGDGDNDPSEDALVHGTAIAAAASEVTDNATLGAGLGFAARLLPVKVFTATGGFADAYAGMIYACENGAQVVNCSWGTATPSAIEQMVVTALREAGCLVVASAGADGDSPVYPAAYDDVLAVTSTDMQDHRASFAGFGPWVDVCAPGVDIRVAHHGGGFASFSGTSFACALVSGFAGLLHARYPDAGPTELEGYILETAVDIDDLNPGFEGLLGAGRIDCAPAIVTAVPPTAGVGLARLTVAPNPGNPLTVVTVDLAVRADVRLDVVDLRGRRLRSLHAGPWSAGRHAVVWDGRDDEGRAAASGVHLLRLATPTDVLTRRFALVR